MISQPLQFQVLDRKFTFSKPEAPTTVNRGDHIVKKVYSNIITKSVKNKKHVVLRQFWDVKAADMNHYKKSRQEKLSAEVMIHISANSLFSDQEPSHISNNIVLQIAKSVKTDANKAVVNSILETKTNLITKQRKLTQI